MIFTNHRMKFGGNPMRNSRALLPILLGCLLFLPGCSRKTPQDLLRTYQDAVNRGRAGKVMTLFAQDAELELAPGFVLQGAEQLRAKTQYDSVVHARISLSGFETGGDTIFCRLEETSDWFNGIGVPTVHHFVAFVVRDGLIRAISYRIAPESHEALHPAFYALAGWVAREHPDRLQRLMPDNHFVYSAQTASEWLDLIRLWREAQR
jgi:hypothetical protein